MFSATFRHALWDHERLLSRSTGSDGETDGGVFFSPEHGFIKQGNVWWRKSPRAITKALSLPKGHSGLSGGQMRQLRNDDFVLVASAEISLERLANLNVLMKQEIKRRLTFSLYVLGQTWITAGSFYLCSCHSNATFTITNEQKMHQGRCFPNLEWAELNDLLAKKQE